MTRALRHALAALALTCLGLPAQAVELVMVERAGCGYCAQWDAEIGPIYPKTPEGAHAPLRRVDIRGPEIETLGLDRRVVFTPTFILVDADDREIARLEGYAGEDFFWGLLNRLLRDHSDFAPPAGADG